jgi:hypothetical protein
MSIKRQRLTWKLRGITNGHPPDLSGTKGQRRRWPKMEKPLVNRGFHGERVTGVEPAPPAWKNGQALSVKPRPL